MDASDVHGDTFVACAITSVTYRVYTLNEPPSLAPEPELVFGSALRKAEVIIRKRLYECRNNLYISLGHTGRDLWVYHIQSKSHEPNTESSNRTSEGSGGGVYKEAPEGTIEGAPNGNSKEEDLDLSSIDLLLKSVINGISVSAQGVFLPPFTNTTISVDHNSNSPRPVGDGRYGPLLRAIEIRCLDALLKNGDHGQYEAFGYNSSLSTGDGSVVSLKPFISQQGVLSLHMNYKKVSLIPVPVSNIQSCASMVWLLPHGKPCRVLSSLRMVSSVEPANVARAQALYRILVTYFVTNITLHQLERSMWMRVSSADAGDMLWPTILIWATPLTSGNGEVAYSNYTPSNFTSQAPTRERTPDTRTELSPLSVSPSSDASSHSLGLHNRHHILQKPPELHRNKLELMNSSSRNTNLSMTRPLVKLAKPDPYSTLYDLMGSVRSEVSAVNEAHSSGDSTANATPKKDLNEHAMAAASAAAAVASSTEDARSSQAEAATKLLLNHPLYPPIAPPSSPRVLSTSVSYADIRALANRDQNLLSRIQSRRGSEMTESNHHPVSFSLGGNSSTMSRNSPAPNLTRSASRAPSLPPIPDGIPASSQVYPTPAYQTPGMPTPLYQTPNSALTPNREPQWMDAEGDDEDMEVGDADFNYFDLPVDNEDNIRQESNTLDVSSHMELHPRENEDHAQSPHRSQHPLENLQNKHIHSQLSDTQIDAPMNDIDASPMQKLEEETSRPDEEENGEKEHSLVPPQWQRRTRFGKLDLYNTELDSKYSTGGRFYVHPESTKEETTSERFSRKGSLVSTTSSITENEVQMTDHDDINGGDVDQDDDSMSDSDYSESSDFMIDDNDGDDSNRESLFIPTPQIYISEDVESAWYRSIKYEEPVYHPVDNSKFDSFRQLIPQIVWDTGMLEEIYDAPIIIGEVVVAPQYVVERIKVVFMNLKQRSIVHPPSKDSNGADTPKLSRTASMANGMNATAHIPQSSHSGQQVNPTFQLFSPPLVAVKRGDFMLRARISILRFWRLLGLSPLANALSMRKQEIQYYENNKSSSSNLTSFASHESTPEDSGTDTSITLILITMASSAVVEGSRDFLDRLCETYDACQLGSVHLPTFGEVDKGLLQIYADLNHTAGDAVGDLYENACTQLRGQIQAAIADNNGSISKNLLVLVCYPPSSLRGGTLTAIVPFQIAQSLSELQSWFPGSQWILSSIDLLVSRWNHDKELSEYEMERAAHHLYNRFSPFPPTFKLASLAPKTSGLQYTSELPQYLMEDEPVLHVAYLIGKGRWCLVSWSDQWAQTTHVDIYKMTDSSDRSLQHVFNEIWNKTVEFSRKIKNHSHWRFCITKCGKMPLYEKEVWSKVIVPTVSVVLLDVPQQSGINSETSINSIRQNSAKPTPSKSPTQSPSSGPPNNAQFGLSVVKSAIGDARARSQPPPAADSVIVDESDVVYGVCVGFPLPLVSGYVNAAAKGFLIRQQQHNEHLTIFEVRLLVLNEFKIPARAVMSRVIGQFRRLASLSEYKGVTTESTLVPWHIMALTKLEAAALKLSMF